MFLSVNVKKDAATVSLTLLRKSVFLLRKIKLFRGVAITKLLAYFELIFQGILESFVENIIRIVNIQIHFNREGKENYQ